MCMRILSLRPFAPRRTPFQYCHLFTLEHSSPSVSPSVQLRRQRHTMAPRQPAWEQPKNPPGVELPPLKIYNSLTRTKNDFVPLDPEGKKVSWYACGPTVYDIAHLGREKWLVVYIGRIRYWLWAGHARNYVSTDIIRRILKDYFAFNVKFVMNIVSLL